MMVFYLRSTVLSKNLFMPLPQRDVEFHTFLARTMDLVACLIRSMVS